MKPQRFKEANIELKKPSNMTDEECSSLWVNNEHGDCISCWSVPFWSRVKFLFHGKIWLGVMGKTQPPVWLDCTKTVFVKQKVR